MSVINRVDTGILRAVKRVRRWPAWVLSLCLAGDVLALSYYPRMDDAQWLVQASRFECRMSQAIPLLGQAVFYRRAGEAAQFYLQTRDNPLARGKASLVSEAPVWKPALKAADLGYVPVMGGARPIQLERKLANRLLAELQKGRAPVFTRQPWYGDEKSIKVSLSSVNFRAAYADYQHCLGQLLPVNYDQIARSRIHFKTDKAELTPKAMARLDLVATYCKADSSINSIFIDGHTDDIASRRYNLKLSQKRAEAVTAYLVSKGLDKEMITTRYHGERFPVKKNNSKANRAYNRRVTVRLDRAEVGGKSDTLSKR